MRFEKFPASQRKQENEFENTFTIKFKNLCDLFKACSVRFFSRISVNKFFWLRIFPLSAYK